MKGSVRSSILCCSGDDVKGWVKCLSTDCPAAVDMLLQLMHAFITTNILSITKGKYIFEKLLVFSHGHENSLF